MTTNAYSSAVADSLPSSPWDILSRPRVAPAAHKVPGKRGPRKSVSSALWVDSYENFKPEYHG